jgi:IS30 family transposase
LRVTDIERELGLSTETSRQWTRQAGGIAPRPRPEPSGRYLSLAEREQIAVLQAAGVSKAQIARELGRAASTIGRELERNSKAPQSRLHRQREYLPVTAHRKAMERARRPKPAKLRVDVNAELHGWVQARLLLKWSPVQISRLLPVAFPDRPEMRVSPETIYQALYVQGRGALRRELHQCLRTGRALRRPKARTEARKPRIPGMVMISERPAEIEDRAVPGHWEGDLIIGAGQRSAIGTLVERSTRFVMLLHLPDRHTAPEVERAMLAAITEMPERLRGSVTWDQGSEMSNHASISLASGMDIYFCDPHSPWQRGSNENTNGLLRQYFPKGTDLSVHDADELRRVADELNDRPRQTLGWRSPRQALNELLLATTA